MLKNWSAPVFQYCIKMNNIEGSVSHMKNTHFSFFEWALCTLDKKLLHNTSINQKSQFGKHYLSFLEAKCQRHQAPPKCDKVRHWQIRLWPWQWILSSPGSEGQKDNDSSSHRFLKRKQDDRIKKGLKSHFWPQPTLPLVWNTQHRVGGLGAWGQQPDDDDQRQQLSYGSPKHYSEIFWV